MSDLTSGIAEQSAGRGAADRAAQAWKLCLPQLGQRKRYATDCCFPSSATQMSTLMPPSSIFHGNPAHFAYELSVAQQLQYVRDEAALGMAYMYCLPSFEPEWAVFLMTSGRKRHFIHHAAASQQIYGTTIKTNVHVMRFESDLSADLAQESSIHAIKAAIAWILGHRDAV